MAVRLTGRLALVTGGSRGIGAAIAVALAENGADVVVNYRNSDKAAQETVEKITALGRKAIALKADVSSAEQVNHLAEVVSSRMASPVSILVNNAGIAPRHDFHTIDDKQWDEVMDGNLKSAFFVSRAFLPAMRRQKWGRIVFVSSIAASTGGIVGPHYTASKAGMLGLMHYFAKHFISDGVTANAIAPALIDTELASGLEEGAKLTPVGRLGTPEEIADGCVLLATNGFMNGQTVQIDGGLYFS